MKCADCGHESAGEFCPACGQRMNVNPQSIGYWVRTFLEETISLDGRLVTTLRCLTTKPGFLTSEWYAGRQRRWSHPFRVYLLTSIIFFTASVVAPEAMIGSYVSGPGAAAEQAAIDQQLESAGAILPQVVILLVPLFAMLLKVGFSWKRYYTEHLVFGLHVHSFAFLVLSLFYTIILLPDILALPLLLGGIIWMFAYLVLASRRTYGVGWLRGVFVSAMVVLLQGTVLWSVARGGSKLLAEDPSAAVAHAESRYWEARAGGVYAGFVIVDYERLPEYAQTPLLRAHAADLLLEVNRSEEAILAARTALLSDPSHLLALKVAARAAEADSLVAEAAAYRNRFLAAYYERINDEDLVGHKEELEDFREIVSRTVPVDPGPRI